MKPLLRNLPMNPTTSNNQTLLTYNSTLPAYLQGTPDEVTGSVKEWIDTTLSFMNPQSKILEIGSGTGRDAAYIESRGFRVERSDAAESFVNHLRDLGYETKLFNVVTQTIPERYDLIYANCVFLHFTEKELCTVLNTVAQGLNDSGILAFSVKLGEGEDWTTEKVDAPRFFRYWQPDPLQALVEQYGFRLLESRCDGKFIQLIAQKSHDHQ